MGLLSHKVKKEDVKPGDHIYTYRALYTYSHHGIYVGENKVIHFTSDNNSNLSSSSSSSSFSYSSGIPYACPNLPNCGVRKPNNGVILSCLDCFLAGGALRLYHYGVSTISFFVKARGGCCTMAQSDPPETVVDRATRLLQIGFGEYDVLNNNCEDFALYCKTCLVNIMGGGSSGQALSFFASIFGAETAAILYIPARLLFASNPVGLAAAALTVGTHCFGRYASDIGGASTLLVKVPIEKAVAALKARDDSRRK